MKIIGNGGHAKVIAPIIESYGIGYFPYNAGFIAIGDNKARKREAKLNDDLRFPVLVSPDARVSKDAFVGEGTVIMAGVIVQTGAKIGKHVILNTGCVVDHDCVIEDYAHIAPGAHLCGDVHIGEGTLVGVGVGIAPGTRIPSWCVVKAARLDICPTM